eukprot:350413-Chlamydomonas_euryale.AAC.11
MRGRAQPDPCHCCHCCCAQAKHDVENHERAARLRVDAERAAERRRQVRRGWRDAWEVGMAGRQVRSGR